LKHGIWQTEKIKINRGNETITNGWLLNNFFWQKRKSLFTLLM